MRWIQIALPVSALTLLLAASPAEAKRAARASSGSTSTPVALGLGADYIVDPEIGEFQATLAVETRVARGLTVGARFGALVTSGDSDVGAPIDLRLRLRTHGIYLDGLVGPWLIFDSGDTLRFHGAFGFGFLMGAMSLGLEVGALDRSGIVGLRLAFSL
jgi:hypothetical protein